MEMERELPNDIASLELDSEGSRGDAKPSESLLTLKRSWSQDTITGSSDLCPDAIHLDFLVEKGWIDYDSLDQRTEDEGGDYSRCLTSPSDLGEIADIVNEMRNEFVGKLSSNVKGLRRILIKGMMEPDVGRSVRRDHKSELASMNLLKVKLEDPKCMNDTECSEEKLLPKDGNRNDDIAQLMRDINQFTRKVEKDPDSLDLNSQLAAKIVAEVELEVPKFLNDKESPEEGLSIEDGKRDDDIIQLISDINQFSCDVERDPDSVDWSHFRANLLKIHRHYVRKPATKALYQIGVSSSNISVPVDDLKSEAKYLRRKVRGLESKILNLDQTLDEFSENFKRSLASNECLHHEMMALSIMRDRIGQRLSELEDEFRRARRQLFLGAKDADQKKQRVPPLHDCEV